MSISGIATRNYRKITKSVGMRGVKKTLIYALQWPFIVANERHKLRERNSIQFEFDRQYKTDTAGIIPLSTFAIEDPLWVHGVRYAPTSPQAFRDALSLLELSPERYRDFTFVDVGSGKGAVLLYAAELKFKAIYGIELVGQLHDIAVTNIARYPAARGITTPVCGDATKFQMPGPPLLVFFNYPFSSRELMERVIANISNAGPGPKFIVAMNYPYDPSAGSRSTLRLIRRVATHRADYAFEVL